MGFRSVRLGVIGLDHLHIFELVQGLMDAGATSAAHVAGGEFLELYEGWRTDSVRHDVAQLLSDDDIDVVVTAGIPSERADIAVAALEAGKDVLSAKPGVTTGHDLQRVRRAVESSGRRWSVLFTERFTNRAVSEAVRLARTGAIGEVAHVIGSGPHALNRADRPAWFFDAATSGGILVDLASHQVDQFLAITGDLGAAVTAASVGNLTCPDHPRFADIGTLRLVARTQSGPPVVGDHRVDLLSPAGLGTWGDVRVSIIGTTGTLEVRANIDPVGASGGEHLIVVDGDGTRRVDCSSVSIDWAQALIADWGDGGARLMSQEHTFAVSELTLTAQASAVPWGAAH